MPRGAGSPPPALCFSRTGIVRPLPLVHVRSYNMPDVPSAAAGTAARSAQDLLRQRLLRLTLMVAVILTGVAGLAVAAVLMGRNARREQQRAEAAEQQGQEQLWASYLAQASALRQSGMQGRRGEGMAALQKAAAGWRALHGAETGDSPARRQLRDEAAALLALPDLSVSRAPYPLPEKHTVVAVNAARGLLATSSVFGDIVIRRLTDGAQTAALEGGGDGRVLTGLEWRPGPPDSPQTSLIAAWYKSGDAIMWSLPGGKRIYYLHVNTGLMSGGPSPGSFSADGRYMAYYTGDASALTIFDLSQGKPAEHRLPPGRTAFAIRPGSTEIAMFSAGAVTLIDFATGTTRRTWPVAGWVQRLVWSSDGQRLAGMSQGGDVFIWSMESAAVWALAGHTALCRALTFSPDGRTLMSSSQDGTTRWWDVERGSLGLIGSGGKGLSYTADGRSIVFETGSGGLGEWTLTSSTVQQTVPLPGTPDAELEQFDLSPDGAWAAAAAPRGMMLCSTENSALRSMQWRPLLRSFAFEASGGLLSNDGGALLRSAVTAGPGGVPLLEPRDPPPVRLPEGERLRLMSPGSDGRTLLVEFESRRAGIADLQGERAFVPLSEQSLMVYYKAPGTPGGGGRLVVSADGRRAAYAYGIKSGAAVFDTATGRELWTSSEGSGVAGFSPDSRHLLLSMNGSASLVRTGDWTEAARRTLPGQLGASSAIAFRGDGALAALASGPQVMELCRGGDLSPVLRLTPPVPRNIRGCRMSRDGARLMVACSGNEFTLWNLRALRQELGTLGLDWTDSPAALPPAVITAAAAGGGGLGFTLWLCAAAIAAAVAAVVLLRRHHGLMHDFAGAEAQLTVQRQDLERANFSLLHSQKMKALGTLAAGMAHDFNNLLSVIRMSNKLIARETRGNGEVTELVDSVESAVLQGKQVVSSMLSYSREETGPPRPIVSIVREAAALLSTEFLSGIALTLDLDEHAPAVHVPAGRIEQILLNLIVNASEAMQGSGKLTIAVRAATPRETAACVLPPRAAPEYVEVSVTDSGPGIPHHIADRIFEPFFTTKNAGNERGTGLGLSMVYTIAERDGMGLALRSVPGEGATFSLFLAAPVCESPTDAAPLPA